MHENRVPIGLIDQTEDPILAPLFERLRGGAVGLVNIHRTLANTPEVFQAFITLAHALRFKTSLDPAERELAILRALQYHRGAYELRHHRTLGANAGLTEAELDLACSDADPAPLGPRRAALILYADAFAANHGVDPALADAIKAELDDRALAELSLTLALYIGLAHLTGALDVPTD